jgi:hypothetical protein
MDIRPSRENYCVVETEPNEHRILASACFQFIVKAATSDMQLTLEQVGPLIGYLQVTNIKFHKIEVRPHMLQGYQMAVTDYLERLDQEDDILTAQRMVQDFEVYQFAARIPDTLPEAS